MQKAFAEACNELGYPTVDDLNDGELDPKGSVGKLPMNVVDDVRMSTALTYLSTARDRANLTVLAGRTVDRVLIENGTATGVIVRKGGVEERYDAGRVTLSAGAFGTPAILMRSGIGPRATLDALGVEVVADLAGVGENLMDHPTSALALAPKPGVCNPEDPLVQMMLRYTSSGSSDVDDMQLYFLSNVDLGGGWSTEAGEMAGASLAPILNPGLQKPRSRGRVTITSTDPDAAPDIALRFLSDDEDRRKLIEGVRVSGKLAATTPIASLIDGMVGLTPEAMESDAAVSEYLDATVTTILHASGTARMGRADDPMAVVDERFGVHGVANLRVVDVPPPPRRFTMPDLPARPGAMLLRADGVAIPDRLRRTDLAVSSGDRLVVTGPNGAGKSTLLAALAGSLRPRSGTVSTAPDIRIGWLGQESDLSADVGAELSVGSRRRVDLAHVLAARPHVLLLDEPTNHLSPTLVDELTAALRATDAAVVVATHDRTLLADLADWPRLDLGGGDPT
ncbi:MAG: ATP-binding cassette domain-containing protein [Pseudonocardiaceae bacterium]|nr:MAG: ATP-binding cassette domain-containing protein [Pseudonocardiaceae bacterium]